MKIGEGLAIDENGVVSVGGQQAITAISITESETGPWTMELTLASRRYRKRLPSCMMATAVPKHYRRWLKPSPITWGYNDGKYVFPHKLIIFCQSCLTWKAILTTTSPMIFMMTSKYRLCRYCCVLLSLPPRRSYVSLEQKLIYGATCWGR